MIGSMLRKAQLSGGCDATASPDAPYDLTSSGVTSSSITLNWEDATSTPNEASSYEVGISSNGGTTWTTVTVSAPASLYTFSGLSSGTTHHFRIRGINCAGASYYDGEGFTQATSAGTLSPSWSLDFSSGTPSGYTLTRASSGTYVDSSGYIASASTDVARLTHDSSGSRLGLLVEESRINRCLQSEDLSTSWLLTNATVTANDTTAPDNTTTADKLTEGNIGAISRDRSIRAASLVWANSTTYTLSIYAKADTATVIQFWVGDATFGTDFWQNYDLANGVLGSSGGASGSSAGMENVGNGWYRCWLTGTTIASNGRTWYISLTDNSTTATRNTSYVRSSNARSLWLWGGQIEVGSHRTSYIPTTTANVTRSADLAHVLDSAITDWGWGALVIHFYPPGQAGTLISTDDASASQYGIQADTATSARGFWQTGQTTSATLGTGIQKAAHFISGSTSKFVLNGGTVYSVTNDVTHSNIDFVTLGAEATDSSGVPGTFSQWANCVIRKIEWYGDGNLTNAQLQAITT